MNIEANTLPQSQASFGATFYSNQNQDCRGIGNPSGAKDTVIGQDSECLDKIVLNCNTKEQLLLQNRWKLNRELKDALVIEGVIEKKAVRSCLKSCVSFATEVEIHLPKDKSKAILKNVHTCKNFWQCPVCRGNALHKKRKDIRAVIEKSKSKNLMATFTIRHTRNDSLISMIEGLQSASSDLWRDRVWLGLKKK